MVTYIIGEAYDNKFLRHKIKKNCRTLIPPKKVFFLTVSKKKSLQATKTLAPPPPRDIKCCVPNNRYLTQSGVALRNPPPPTGVTPALLRNKTIHIMAFYNNISPINLNQIKIIAVSMAILHLPSHPLSTSAHKNTIISCSISGEKVYHTLLNCNDAHSSPHVD